MTLDEFVTCFAEQFENTPMEAFTADGDFRDNDEWGSLTGLSIIAMIDDEFDKTITGADLRSCKTIRALYELIQSK